ncbi:MAG: hypothetical protein IKU36_01770 [Bacteroidales bacterium]|nr:hypothetical protein [Clostridiales bacterium]MBR5298958.1 hypothetical protein [Bacteroidales bacterium]
MVDIFDKQLLRVTKGNSAEIAISIIDKESGEPIVIGATDTVIFTASDKAGKTVIQKTLTIDNLAEDGHSLLLEIGHDETMLQTGEYPYDVMLVTDDPKKVMTFISSTLIIEPAVGLYTDNVGGDDGE